MGEGVKEGLKLREPDRPHHDTKLAGTIPYALAERCRSPEFALETPEPALFGLGQMDPVAAQLLD